MGCVPPERRQPVAVASVAVKKGQSSKQLESKRNSSNSIDNNNLKASTQSAPYFQTKQSRHNREGSGSSSPKFKTISGDSKQTYVYGRDTTKSGKETIRVLPPVHTNKESSKKPEQLSRLVSIHSLDINSTIKVSEVKTPKQPHKLKEDKHLEPYSEEINITFNNNNFATHNSAAKQIGMGRKWREEILKQELSSINEENFRRIHVEAMPFN